jgi:hypothetical protein
MSEEDYEIAAEDFRNHILTLVKMYQDGIKEDDAADTGDSTGKTILRHLLDHRDFAALAANESSLSGI